MVTISYGFVNRVRWAVQLRWRALSQYLVAPRARLYTLGHRYLPCPGKPVIGLPPVLALQLCSSFRVRACP
jgi:hypothetical protein